MANGVARNGRRMSHPSSALYLQGGRPVEILTQRHVVSGIRDELAGTQFEHECPQAATCPMHVAPTCLVHLVNRWRQNDGGYAG